MKLSLVIAAGWMYQNVVADFDPNSANPELDGDDTRYTDKQKECLFNPDTVEDCSNSAKGFDTTVKKWTNYWHPVEKKYIIPMHIQTATYSSDKLPKLWESLNWAKDQFAEHTSIKLVFIDQWQADNVFKKGYIKPSYQGACWSYLGNLYETARWKFQPMDIGWCYKVPGSIVHETMHALGFVHEHMRSDRDQYLSVTSRNAANCKKYVAGRLDTSGTPYDLGSIMHYGEGACGIRVRDRSKRRLVGNRRGFSKYDIQELNTIYPASGPE